MWDGLLWFIASGIGFGGIFRSFSFLNLTHTSVGKHPAHTLSPHFVSKIQVLLTIKAPTSLSKEKNSRWILDTTFWVLPIKRKWIWGTACHSTIGDGYAWLIFVGITVFGFCQSKRKWIWDTLALPIKDVTLMQPNNFHKSFKTIRV